MKLTSLSLVLLLAACTVQPLDPNKKDSTDVATATPTATAPVKGAQPNKGICSYSNDPDKGCLKATISGSNLSVGDFQYDLGAIAFVRLFPKDLTDSHYFNLPAGQTVAFARSTTVNNFFDNFSVSVEGSHTSYSATHTGLGNLQVNNMFVGTYDIMVSKQFNLKVVDTSNTIVGYKCAVIWSRQSIDIAAGEETPLPQSIGQFNLDAFDESCQGPTVTSVYPPAPVASTSTSTATDPTPSPSPSSSSSTSTSTSTSSGSNQGSSSSN